MIDIKQYQVCIVMELRGSDCESDPGECKKTVLSTNFTVNVWDIRCFNA